VSKASILSMVGRIERIADMMPGHQMSEVESLVAQALGTAQAIEQELSRHGISIENDRLSKLFYKAERERSIDMASLAIHTAAGYFRGLAERLE